MFKKRPTETYREYQRRLYILEMRIIAATIILLMLGSYTVASRETLHKRECTPAHHVG